MTPPKTTDTTISVRNVATFWHGPPLARLDLACLLSFIAAGFNVTVYGYEPIAGLPAGVTFGNAEDIVERTYLEGFIVNGKPSLSHFSDLFRYRLFAATGEAWVDMDLLCLKPFDMPTDHSFFAKETDTSISSSVLRIDRGQPELETLIAQAEEYGSGAQFEWGSTGPALLTRTFPKEVLDQALQPKHFFPVPWDEWWKPFVPSAREECEQLCSEASAIHLWNNIVERSGYWKDLAPPRGSYLHAALERQDLLGAFRDTYPERVMEHIAHNYRDSRTAAHMPVKQLVQITVPRVIAGVRKKLGSS